MANGAKAADLTAMMFAETAAKHGEEAAIKTGICLTVTPKSALASRKASIQPIMASRVLQEGACVWARSG